MADQASRPPIHYDLAAPIIPTEAEPTCPVCRAAKRRFFASGYDYEMQTCANEWNFVECEACATVWLDPRPAISTLDVIYPASYYAYDMSTRLNPIVRKAKEIIDGLKFGSILGAIGRKPKSYLDVGCGDGRYLYSLAKAGVPRDNIYGLDLPSPGLKPLREAGFKVIEGRVEDCREIALGTLDLITIFHVIEHVANPVEVMQHLADWLAPGGVLAVETPNLDSMDARVFKRRFWGGYHIPRHWTLFTQPNLERALKSVGLEPIAVRYQTGHSFWLYSFHHYFKHRERDASPFLARRFDPMTSKVALAFFTGFDILRRTFGMRTSAMLVLARKPS